MKETKAQEFFNASVAAVARQGHPAMDSSGQCLYLGPGGDRCAVGHLLSYAELEAIDDKSMYIISLSNFGLLPKRLTSHLELLCDLQNAHDNCSGCHPFVECFLEAAELVAVKHELKMPELLKLLEVESW